MGTVIRCTHLGDHQTELHHGPTGKTIITDLPPDNGGQGRTFSPTDLFASSLASCILTIMGKAAEKHGEDLRGTTFEIEKHMQENPRRIGRFVLHITFPDTVSADHRKRYLQAVQACPVHRSLHPDIQVEVHSN